MQFSSKFLLGAGGTSVALAGTYVVHGLYTETLDVTEIFKTNKQQIEELTESWKDKCQVYIELNVSYKAANTAEEEELKDLYSFAKTKGTDCQSRKSLVFKRTNESWDLLDEQAASKLWLSSNTDFSNNCDIKIFSSSENQSIENAADMVGLFDFLNKGTIKSSCTSGSSSNKEEIVLKKSATNNTWYVAEELEQVKQLLKKQTFKCEIKVKVGEQIKDVLSATESDGLTGLLSKLKTMETSDCQSNESTKTPKILKQSGTTWVEFSEKEYIEEHVKGWSGKCVLKIRKDQENQELSAVSDDLTGLYSLIKNKDTECGSSAASPTSPKELVYKKSDTWKEMSEYDQIKDLTDSWKGKCSIKVRSNGSNQEIDDNNSAGLYKELKNKKNECKSVTSEKKFVYQKSEDKWSIVDEKTQITELIKNWTGKCTIKVWIDNAPKDVTNVENTQLEGLYSEIEKKKTECEKEGTSKTLIYKKNGTKWEETTEKKQIEELMKDKESVCTLKIRTGETGSQADKELKNLEVTVDLSGLYAELAKNKEQYCPSSQTSKTDLIYQKNGSSWKKAEPATPTQPKGK